jgi:hypothetical protein
MLKILWKKGNNSKMGYGIYFKIAPILELFPFFSSNFQHFNTFRPLFQKLLEINVKFKLQTCSASQDLPTMQFWSKSRNQFWSYFPFCFWNKGRKVLKCWKFDEKREITPKWVTGFTSKLHGRQILQCWTCLHCNFEVNSITHFGIISLFFIKFSSC